MMELLMNVAWNVNYNMTIIHARFMIDIVLRIWAYVKSYFVKTEDECIKFLEEYFRRIDDENQMVYDLAEQVNDYENIEACEEMFTCVRELRFKLITDEDYRKEIIEKMLN